MISILCPTRGRPEKCRRMIDSAFSTAFNKDNIDIIVDLSMDDERRSEYDLIGVRWGFENLTFTVDRWNILAREAIYVESQWKNSAEPKLFMLGSDDIIFTTPGWDQALIDHYNALENKIHVYHLQDSRDPEGTPHPIVTREYIDAMGYFLPPIFLHWYGDSWTRDIAKANNCFTHMKDYLLIHDKPSDRGEGDETHNRIRRMGWHERDTYVNSVCGHFLELEKQRLATKMNRKLPAMYGLLSEMA